MHAPWVTPFLEQLALDGNVARCARVAGISSATAYALRKVDGDFAAAWELAKEDATDVLIAEARRRAVDGIDELVVHQGAPSPVWERDAKGQVVLEEYDDPNMKSGKGHRPVQARNPDGSLRWLTRKVYSDGLLTVLMKGDRPQYATARTEVTGAGGAPLQIDATQRRARIASILEAAKARVGLA